MNGLDSEPGWYERLYAVLAEVAIAVAANTLGLL